LVIRGPSSRARASASGLARRHSVTGRIRDTTTSSVAPEFHRKPDPQLLRGVAGAQGDIAEQGAQHAFAVPVAGRRGRPQRGQVRDHGGEFVGGRQRRLTRRGGGQRGLGIGEFDQAGLPAGFQAAGDQTVLRFTGGVRPLRPFGGIPGAFHAQLGRATRSGTPRGDLVRGGQRQRDLVRADRRGQRCCDRVVHGAGRRATRRSRVARRFDGLSRFRGCVQP
jgi:hypothetical protein